MHQPSLAPIPHSRHNNPARTLQSRKTPFVKVELDQMLDNAYLELRSQPKKNLALGQPDVFVLPNKILKDYISSIYDEYSINDPILTNKCTFRNYKSQCKPANAGSPNRMPQTRNQVFQTPKINKVETFQSTHHRSTGTPSRTKQKLDRLKQNIVKELSSGELDQQVVSFSGSNNEETAAIAQFVSYKSEVYQKPISSQLVQPSTQILQSCCIFPPACQEPRYCFICEQPLFTVAQSVAHLSSCKQLIDLKNNYHPRKIPVSKLASMAQMKIERLKLQVIEDSKWLQGDLKLLEHKVVDVANRPPESRELTVKHDFMNSKIISCWKLLDLLEWYLQMRKKIIQHRSGAQELIGIK